ncbi:hypothetical protein GCM10011507_34940 [Edaphobacter acidisoli]|uniref:Uncharacterized protein n=1 Tax=Edaphobacter acidisoli TaxID=2040573 RepID=A0A916S2F7_9BACT|nr:hypothetical protein [Edaphobacter acidisoli]GGA80734.1 hypothetical protein GCM10011507_34940 [Edaphobacter acidisoli]
MGARGINLAEEGHVISILSPQSISGGVAATPFNLKNAAKANIIIQLGALAIAPGAITLNACSDISGDGATAIPFTYYKQTTSGNANDTLSLNGSTPSTAFAATSAGFTPADTANTFYEIVVQADQLPAGLPYLQLELACGSGADYASAVAILTGLNYPGSQQPTATT